MSVLCPICNDKTFILDVVDFNKSCEEQSNKYLTLSGIPIYYNMCSRCNFTFSTTMYGWSENDYIEKVYNDQYVNVDPDYVENRPKQNYNLLNNIFGSKKDFINHLDYGGGNGLLSDLLKKSNWNSNTYDPFPKNDIDLGSLGKYDLITSFEVFEHVPDVNELMNNLKKLSRENSIILFSTYVSDNQIFKNKRIDWWYCSPRNGHVSIFSLKSLQILGERYGFKIGSINHGLHLFYNQIPEWASSIIKIT